MFGLTYIFACTFINFFVISEDKYLSYTTPAAQNGGGCRAMESEVRQLNCH